LTEAIEDHTGIDVRKEREWSAEITEISKKLPALARNATHCMTAFRSCSCNPDADTGTITIIIHLMRD
jgi:hypothetical protein